MTEGLSPQGKRYRVYASRAGGVAGRVLGGEDTSGSEEWLEAV